MVAAPGRKKLAAAQLKILRKRSVGDRDPGLRDVDFQGASLAGCDLRYLDLQGADLTDCDLRAANLQGTDLRGALFTTEQIILAANWPLARYSDTAALSLPANHDERLQIREFTGQSLRHVNFTDANLDSFNLGRARLEGSCFYDASWIGARLEDVPDLAAWQFRGAVLTGARLPEPIKKFEGLKAVEANTKVAARSFTATILACLYCWLTIGTTTDAEFFGAEHATALPFLQTKISPYGFYAVAPLLLAVMFLYLQFSLQQLWEAFASLPAYFDDGRPLHERAAPFFLSAIVRTQFPRLREKAPGLPKAQAILAWLLGWWVVPFTIATLWWRSLVARLAWLTAIQLLSLWVAAAASLFFISIAGRTLRGVPIDHIKSCRQWRQWLSRTLFPQKLAWAALVTAGLSVFSVLVFQGARIPLLRFNADLSYARLSPSEPSTAEDGELRTNSLKGRNLQNCFARHAEMANVDLSGANLSGCYLEGADLRNADLTGADLSATKLDGANLRGATMLPRSDVESQDWVDADVQGAEIYLDSTKLLFSIVDTTNNWILANWKAPNDTAGFGGIGVYLPDFLWERGLPKDHNERLARKDLSGYDFDKLKSHRMQRADLKGWILHNCIFTGVDLQGTDLSHSDLRDTRFYNAGLTNVNFEGADLRGVDLSNAQGLTQWQLNSAITGKSDITGKKTQLPQGLHGQAER